MVLSIPDLGKEIYSMVSTEKRPGQIVQSSRVSIEKARRMGSVSIYGLTEQNTKENGKIMRSVVMDFIDGLMEGDTSDIGKPTLWTNLECIHGQTGGCMRASTRKIKSMVSVCIPGLMVNGMLAGGAGANNTD